MMPEETPNMPDWFREADHLVTTAGIVRRADLALLAEDGKPASPILRMMEDRALDAAAYRRTKKEQSNAGE